MHRCGRPRLRVSFPGAGGDHKSRNNSPPVVKLTSDRSNEKHLGDLWIIAYHQGNEGGKGPCDFWLHWL